MKEIKSFSANPVGQQLNVYAVNNFVDTVLENVKDKIGICPWWKFENDGGRRLHGQDGAVQHSAPTRTQGDSRLREQRTDRAHVAGRACARRFVERGERLAHGTDRGTQCMGGLCIDRSIDGADHRELLRFVQGVPRRHHQNAGESVGERGIERFGTGVAIVVAISGRRVHG